MMKEYSKMTQEELEKELAEIVNITMNNLLVTHSPSIETDNLLSGEMDKYYFDNPANVSLKNNELTIREKNTNESLHFDTSKIEDISPVSKNDKWVFQQDNAFAMLYDGGQVITFYFDWQR